MGETLNTQKIAGIVHEHHGYLSPAIWGGFAIYPNSLRKGFSKVIDSPVTSLIQAGDRILKELQISTQASSYSKAKARVLPHILFNQIRSAFLRYDPKKKTVLYHHMNSFVLPPEWLLKVSEFYNLRLVTSIVDFQEHVLPEFLGTKIYERRQKNYEVTFSLASGFVTASPFLVESANTLLGISKEKITVAPLGWDHMPELSLIQSTPVETLVDTSKPYFLFPSKAWAHKGHLELISSFKGLGKELNLVLVGGLDAQKESLENVIRDTGQEESISILGYRDEIDLYALIYRADGLVFPSIYEGFGLPYIEAAQLRTPVIAFENESVNHLLGKSGAYLHPQGAFGKMIESLPFSLIDSNRGAIIDEAFKRTEELTWENTARKTLEMYVGALQ
jgi:glycosyltransferase involved in cell wall biosynthesis